MTAIEEALKKTYDFVIIGSGAGAGPVIYELSKAGKQILVLEKGPYFRTSDFRKDELTATRRSVYTPPLQNEFHVIVQTNGNGTVEEQSTFDSGWDFWNGNMVGGSSNIMSGYFHRMKPVDFKLLSRYGEIPGANMVDWPIDYEELEPYYTKVEQIVGVSGKVVKHKFAEPRSTPEFPYPPLRVNIVSSWIDEAGRKTGMEIIPTPRAILSRNEGNRKACYYSHYCGSYGCASDAKGSARTALIEPALRTGNVTLITNAFVFHLETDGHYRIRQAHFFDAAGKKHGAKGKNFVVAAQAIETVRLLLNSKNPEFPYGLANNHGQVGKNLLFSAGGTGEGEIDLTQLDEATRREVEKPGVFINRSTQFFYEIDGRKPLKGGTVDFLFEHANPVPKALRQMFDGDRMLLSREYRKRIKDYFRNVRTLQFEIFTDWIPHDGCYVDLSSRKDYRGIPVARIHIDPHPAQRKPGEIIARETEKLFRSMGLKNIRSHITDLPPANLQAGGARFGNNPETSVLNRYCQAHEVPNLFITDGSFMPTGGSVPYTWTIYANAFRVADFLKKL